MTDLESQLRDCLDRHAAKAAIPADLLSATRARSRALSRRMHTAAVIAVVPVTAAVVLGSMSIAGSSTGTGRAQVHPLASVHPLATVSPPQRPTPVKVAGCPSGTVPNLHIVAGDGSGHHTSQVIRHLLAQKQQGGHLHWSYIVGLHHVMLDGHVVAAHRLAVAIERTNNKRYYLVMRPGAHGGLAAYRAKLLACSPAASP